MKIFTQIKTSFYFIVFVPIHIYQKLRSVITDTAIKVSHSRLQSVLIIVSAIRSISPAMRIFVSVSDVFLLSSAMFQFAGRGYLLLLQCCATFFSFLIFFFAFLLFCRTLNHSQNISFLKIRHFRNGFFEFFNNLFFLFAHCIIPFCDIIFSKTEELTCF